MDAEPTTNTRTLAVIDDHELVGVALRAALSEHPRLRLTQYAPTVEAYLGSGQLVDLVLLDLRLADGSSPAANLRALAAIEARVLAFTSGEDSALVREALRGDVLGVVRKSAPVERIVAAIGQAADGSPVVTSEWAHVLESDPRTADAGLSPQEARVLRLFADGARAQTVAEQLFITVGTLEDYVRRIRSKYARAGRPAPTKVDLYKRAVEDGLLPGPHSG